MALPFKWDKETHSVVYAVEIWSGSIIDWESN